MISCDADRGGFGAAMDTVFRGRGTGTTLGMLVGRCCGFVESRLGIWDACGADEFWEEGNGEHTVGIPGGAAAS